MLKMPLFGVITVGTFFNESHESKKHIAEPCTLAQLLATWLSWPYHRCCLSNSDIPPYVLEWVDRWKTRIFPVVPVWRGHSIRDHFATTRPRAGVDHRLGLLEYNSPPPSLLDSQRAAVEIEARSYSYHYLKFYQNFFFFNIFSKFSRAVWLQ